MAGLRGADWRVEKCGCRAVGAGAVDVSVVVVLSPFLAGFHWDLEGGTDVECVVSVLFCCGSVIYHSKFEFILPSFIWGMGVGDLGGSLDFRAASRGTRFHITDCEVRVPEQLPCMRPFHVCGGLRLSPIDLILSPPSIPFHQFPPDMFICCKIVIDNMYKRVCKVCSLWCARLLIAN